MPVDTEIADDFWAEASRSAPGFQEGRLYHWIRISRNQFRTVDDHRTERITTFPHDKCTLLFAPHIPWEHAGFFRPISHLEIRQRVLQQDPEGIREKTLSPVRVVPRQGKPIEASDTIVKNNCQ